LLASPATSIAGSALIKILALAYNIVVFGNEKLNAFSHQILSVDHQHTERAISLGEPNSILGPEIAASRARIMHGL